MSKTKQRWTRSGYWIFFLSIAVIIGAVLLIITKYSKPNDVLTIELSELEDGVYAYREEVISSVPAYNYTLITICSKSGNVYSIKGTVTIVADAYNANAVWTRYVRINSDEVVLYVPPGSVKYLGASTVGRR